MIKSQARRDSGLGRTDEGRTPPAVEEIMARIAHLEAGQNTLLKRFNGYVEKTDDNNSDIAAKLDKLTAAVQSISIEPEDVEKFKQMGLSAAAEVNGKLQESGEIAAEKIRRAGSKSIKEFAMQSFFTAVWFVVLTVAVQYWAYFGNFAPGGTFYDKVSEIADSLNMVHFNQTMPGANFSPWDWDAFVSAWRNQDKYIREQRKQANESGSTANP